jgi:hypothetical protein
MWFDGLPSSRFFVTNTRTPGLLRGTTMSGRMGWRSALSFHAPSQCIHQVYDLRRSRLLRGFNLLMACFFRRSSLSASSYRSSTSSGRNDPVSSARCVWRGPACPWGSFRLVSRQYGMRSAAVLLRRAFRLLTDAVEKVGGTAPARNNRIPGDDLLNRPCAFSGGLESMLLGDSLKSFFNSVDPIRTS